MSNTEQNNDSWRPAGKEWPLLFSYRAQLKVQESLVLIELSGRATAYVARGGAVWMDGVYPGAFTAAGESLEHAEADLRSTLTEVFLDIAHESSDVAEFTCQAEDFLRSTDDATVAEWDSALARVRRSSGVAVAGLKRRSADEHQPYVHVSGGSPQADAPLLLPEKPESLELSAAA